MSRLRCSSGSNQAETQARLLAAVNIVDRSRFEPQYLEGLDDDLLEIHSMAHPVLMARCQAAPAAAVRALPD